MIILCKANRVSALVQIFFKNNINVYGLFQSIELIKLNTLNILSTDIAIIYLKNYIFSFVLSSLEYIKYSFGIIGRI